MALVPALSPDIEARLKERGFALQRVRTEDVEALGLIDLKDPKLDPLFVDFLSSTMRYRIMRGLSKNEPLPKAIGLKSRNPETAPFVFDATGGLGSDALIMSALGCRVRSVERSPIVFALLADGYERLTTALAEELLNEDEHAVFEDIASRLTFEQGDAKTILSELSENERPDVVYCDPMYPEDSHSKSALPKKTMQMFRQVLDGDEDAEQLWEVAMRVAKTRVAVKRPLRAPSLGREPNHKFEGNTARFDLYLI